MKKVGRVGRQLTKFDQCVASRDGWHTQNDICRGCPPNFNSADSSELDGARDAELPFQVLTASVS
jgi:hypothetical protein